MANDSFVIRNGVLIEYNGNGGDVIVPEGIVSIDGAFCFCEKLTSLVLPYGITEIGCHAFWACENLRTISLPESLITIDDWAFDDCSNLVNIKLPQSLVSIGYEAFNNCNKLEVHIEGNPSFDESVFTCIKKVIAPNLPLAKFSTTKEKHTATKGFLSHRLLYKDKKIVEEYIKYIITQKKKLLYDILKEDDVSSLAIYMEIKNILLRVFWKNIWNQQKNKMQKNA